MSHSSTRLSVLRLEGNRAEELKLAVKHTSSIPAGGQPLDKNERAASVLPPSDGSIPLNLLVRIDRKLVSAENLQQSGLLKAVMAFLREYGSRLRIQSVDGPLVDGSRLEVSLQLDPFCSPMMQRFENNAARFEHLDFNLLFYSPPNENSSSTPFRDQLLSNRLAPSVSSLVFRAMLKCWSGLAVKYPLVFDRRWVQHVQDQSMYLSSLSRSLARLSQKTEAPDKTVLLQRCFARLGNSASGHGNNNEGTLTSSVVAEDTHMAGASPTQPTNSQMLESATFALLLRAIKSKHALTKLQLDLNNTPSEDNVNDSSQDQSTSSSLLSASDSSNHSQESPPIDELIPLQPELPHDWMLADSSPSSIIVDDFANPYDVLRAFDFTSQAQTVQDVQRTDNPFDDHDSIAEIDILDAFLPAFGAQSHPVNTLDCFKKLNTPSSAGVLLPVSPPRTTWEEDMQMDPAAPPADYDMLMNTLCLIQAEDELMDIEDSALDEVDAMMEDMIEDQTLDELDAIMAKLVNSASPVTC